MATAAFLDSQRPDGKAFVIGESGLTNAIHEIGYVITDSDPDYVVLGETHDYNISQVTKAIRLIRTGRASSPPIRTQPARRKKASCPRAERWLR